MLEWLCFLFYLIGECLLWMNFDVCGGWFGFGFGDMCGVMMCVVFEGVVFVLCVGFDVICDVDCCDVVMMLCFVGGGLVDLCWC